MKAIRAAACAVFAWAAIPALAAQPHMQAALVALEQAKAELQKAAADKGGHRVKAMKGIDSAIAEVKAGIEWDRTHASKAEKAKK